MQLKKVINLFGGPGVGKSTLAAAIFTELNRNHSQYNIELIPEYAKDLTWEERVKILNGDQMTVFAKQHRRLLRLQDKVDIAICESPLIFPVIYFNEELEACKKKNFENVVVDTFHNYPNYNFFITRDTEYSDVGRRQSQEEAIAVDQLILEFLHAQKIVYDTVKNIDERIIIKQCLA